MKVCVRLPTRIGVILHAAAKIVVPTLLSTEKMWYTCNKTARIILAAEQDQSTRVEQARISLTHEFFKALLHQKLDYQPHLQDYCHAQNPDISKMIDILESSDMYLDTVLYRLQMQEHIVKFLLVFVKLCQRFPLDTRKIIRLCIANLQALNCSKLWNYLAEKCFSSGKCDRG